MPVENNQSEHDRFLAHLNHLVVVSFLLIIKKYRKPIIKNMNNKFLL